MYTRKEEEKPEWNCFVTWNSYAYFYVCIFLAYDLAFSSCGCHRTWDVWRINGMFILVKDFPVRAHRTDKDIESKKTNS